MAKRAKQLEFSGFKKPSDSFGGSQLKSNPKVKRPLDSKYPILATLRANRSSMLNPHKFNQVNDIVRDAAKKYGIKVYDFVNMGNHLHLVFKLHHKRFWAPFIREITSRIAALFPSSTSRSETSGFIDVTKIKSAKNSVSRIGRNTSGDSEASTQPPSLLKFWKHRPHTRIIRSWKQGFKNALEYVRLNKAEAGGFINRKQTKTLKDYRAIFELQPISMSARPDVWHTYF